FSGSYTSPSRCGAKLTCRKLSSSKVSSSLYSDKYFTSFTKCIITSFVLVIIDCDYNAKVSADFGHVNWSNYLSPCAKGPPTLRCNDGRRDSAAAADERSEPTQGPFKKGADFSKANKEA